MSWNTFHRRGETLRQVMATADERRDGVLPRDVPGVEQNFADDLDLVGAMMLKWHARLSGNVERALAQQPMDLESAVAEAWRTTAEQLPGVRLVIDHALDHPEGPVMEQAMGRARTAERANLAVAAGLANNRSAAAAHAGRRVEERARAELLRAPEAVQHHAAAPPSLADRIRAVLAA